MSYPIFPLDLLRRSYEPGWPQPFVLAAAVVATPLGNGRTRTRPECEDGFRGWRCRIRNLDGDDFTVIDTFHRVTVRGCVDPFEWYNPLTGETIVGTFWRREPPAWSGVRDRPDLLVVQFAVIEAAGLTGAGYGGATV
jgi:hypothetical protein